MSNHEDFSAARRTQGIRYIANEVHRTATSTETSKSTKEPMKDHQIANGATCEMDTSCVLFQMTTDGDPLTLQSGEDIFISKTTTEGNVLPQMSNKSEPPACKPKRKRNIRNAEDLNTTSETNSIAHLRLNAQEPVERNCCDDSSATERRADIQNHTPAITKENITKYELPLTSETFNQVNTNSHVSAFAETSSMEHALDFLSMTVSSPARQSYCYELSRWEQYDEQPGNMDVNHHVSRDDVRSAINKVFSVLVDYMDPKPILHKMNEERIFSRRSTLRDIMEKPTTSEKNRNLLELIIRRDVSLYLDFKRFLRDTKQEPIFQLLEIAEKGEDTREAIEMIKQCATELNDQDSLLLRELAAAITMSDMKKKMAICYVYVYIGKEVCRALLEKQVNDLRPSGHDSLTWSIDAFLEMNIETIKPILTNENSYSLFPKAKPDLWNLSLFCHILINTTCKISRPLRMCLKWLLEQETEIEFYNDQNYERKFEHMKECLLTIADETHDEDLIRKAKELFEPFQNGVISNANCEVISRKIERLTEEFKHSMKATENQLQKINKGNLRMEKKLDEVLERLGNISLSNDSLPKSIPDIPVKIRLNEVSPETEIVASERIVKTLNHKETQSKLSEAIDDLNKKFKDNGYLITNNFKVGCVQMYFRCTSALSLFALLKDYVSGRLDTALEPLEKAARMLNGCQRVKLETIIFEDDILNILSAFNVCPIKTNSTDVSELKSDIFEAKTAELADFGVLEEDLVCETTAERQLLPDRGSDPQHKTRFHLTESNLQKGNSKSVNEPLKEMDEMKSRRVQPLLPVDILPFRLPISPAERSSWIKIDLDQSTDKTSVLLCSRCQGRIKKKKAKYFCLRCQTYFCLSCIDVHDDRCAVTLHINAQLTSSDNIPSPDIPFALEDLSYLPRMTDNNDKDITSSTKKSDSDKCGAPKPLWKHPASVTQPRKDKLGSQIVRKDL